MTKISTDKALERWDTLPLVLREALYSEPNSDFLWKTCEAEHIPSDKIYNAARISGYVLMGFLHPEDVAEELQETIGVDKKTASSIETALNQRVFAPLRKEIDAVYAPISKLEVGPKASMSPVPAGPKIIAETFTVKPAAPMAMPLPIPKPAPAPKPPVAAAPIAKPQPPAASPAKPTVNTADKGWSRQGSQDPVIKLGVITPSVPAPKSAPPPAPTPAAVSATAMKTSTQPQSTTPKSISEFERLDMQKKAPTSTPTSSPPAPPPMMLHQVGAPGAVGKTQNFQINPGTDNQMAHLSAQPLMPEPAKPAVIEFGKSPTSAPAPKPTTPPAPPAPASTAPRQVTEITSPNPKPPTPANKVIVKDFLEPQPPR